MPCDVLAKTYLYLDCLDQNDYHQNSSHSLNASTSTAVKVLAGLMNSTVTAAKLPSWPSALHSSREENTHTEGAAMTEP